jgi:hypothetical protein
VAETSRDPQRPSRHSLVCQFSQRIRPIVPIPLPWMSSEHQIHRTDH